MQHFHLVYFEVNENGSGAGPKKEDSSIRPTDKEKALN